jgi:hypothetical protein
MGSCFQKAPSSNLPHCRRPTPSRRRAQLYLLATTMGNDLTGMFSFQHESNVFDNQSVVALVVSNEIQEAAPCFV